MAVQSLAPADELSRRARYSGAISRARYSGATLRAPEAGLAVAISVSRLSADRRVTRRLLAMLLEERGGWEVPKGPV